MSLKHPDTNTDAGFEFSTALTKEGLRNHIWGIQVFVSSLPLTLQDRAFIIIFIHFQGSGDKLTL